MGTNNVKQTPPAKQDFDNLVPFKDIPEAMVNALADGATKEEIIGDEPKDTLDI